MNIFALLIAVLELCGVLFLLMGSRNAIFGMQGAEGFLAVSGDDFYTEPRGEKCRD